MECVLAFGYFDRVHSVVSADLVHHFNSLENFAEDGVNAVEVRLGRVADKELAATGVRSRVRHGERTSKVTILVDFAIDFVAGSTGSRTVGAPALNHEVRNDSVEGESVIEAAIGEFLKVGDRVGSFFLEEFNDHGAVVGFNMSLFHSCPFRAGLTVGG